MAVPHEQLFIDIHAGPGIAGTRATQDAYQRIAQLFAMVEGRIQVGLTDLGIAYEGAGSAAAQSGIAVLQQWTQDAQAAAGYASEVVGYQADSFAHVRDGMPEPVLVTAQDGFFDNVVDFFGGTTPRETQEQQAREAHIRAAQLMSEYDRYSASAAYAMPTFVPPPAVTVEVPQPQPQTTEIGPTGGAVSQGGGTVASGGTSGPAGGSARPAPTPGADGGPFAPPSNAPAPTESAGSPTPPPPFIPAPGGPVPGSQPSPGGYPVPPGGYPLPPGGGATRPPGTVPGTGYPRRGYPGYPGAPAGQGAYRPGLNAGGFGSRGLDPDGFGPRGSGSAGGVGSAGQLGRGGFGPGGGLAAGGSGARAGLGHSSRGGAGVGGFMQPAAPGVGHEGDQEHRRKYVVGTDEYFADDRLVPPPVIGEQTRHTQR